MKKKLSAKPASTARSPGQLVIIGGHEDRVGKKRILREVASRVGRGKLVLLTLASRASVDELWEIYRKAFLNLGIKRIEHLDLASREEAVEDPRLKKLEGASVVFFTGGDQLRITSQLGGTALSKRIHEILDSGGTLAGTSAGASVMSETMLVSGPATETYRVGGSLSMAPGLGYARGMIIDQHFAERGRIGRLLGALAQNPERLAVGIDEDTSMILSPGSHFRVVGAGGVYVLDGWGVSGTNVSEASEDHALSIFGVKLHVLSDGDEFDLKQRKPISGPSSAIRAA